MITKISKASTTFYQLGWLSIDRPQSLFDSYLNFTAKLDWLAEHGSDIGAYTYTSI